MKLGDYTVFFLFAESVRHEPGNRHTIIGTMPENLHLPVSHGAIPLAIYARIDPAPPEGTPIKVICTRNGEPFLETEGETPPSVVDIEQPAITVAASGALLQVDGDTRVEALVAVGNMEPQKTSVLKVICRPPEKPVE